MNILDIIPSESIGTIKIGMTRMEAEANVNAYANLIINLDFDLDNKVNFIEVGYATADYLQCLYNDIDLFNTKVDELIKLLDQISPYDRSNAELGYTYNFPLIGLSLWRSVMLSDEDLQQDWFKELDPEIQKDEMKYLFFEAVAVYKPGYYDNITF